MKRSEEKRRGAYADVYPAPQAVSNSLQVRRATRRDTEIIA
ncbi:MAG: hypothetical protein WCE87_11300 [Candidatus Udaeobacter sp.]